MSTQSIPVSPTPITPSSLAAACFALAEKLKPIPPANMKAILLALDPFFDELRTPDHECEFDLDEIGEEVKNLLAYHSYAVSSDAEHEFNKYFSDFAAVMEFSICFLNRLAPPSASEAQDELYRIGSNLGMDVFSGNENIKDAISNDPISFYFKTSKIEEIIHKWNEQQSEEYRLQVLGGNQYQQ
jgi:hypothetical protein